MRGEQRVHGNRFQCAEKVEPLAHQVAHAFEDQKRGVAFVDVPDCRLYAHCVQRAHAANAEDDLLLDTGVTVAAVEPVRDVAIFRAVRFEVRIEKVKDDPPDTRPPYPDRDIARSHLDGDAYLAAVFAQRRRYRQVAEIRIGVSGMLVALAVYLLLEIALAVEQPHRDERNVQIARRLAMVPGQDAEPSGVNWQAFMKAELGTEVGDQIAFR